MEEYDKTFEAYFSGKMSGKESLDFESAMLANPQLKSDYEFYVAVKRSAADIKREAFRKEIENIDLDHKQEGQTKTPSAEKRPTTKIFTLMKSIIAIAALFIIGFWGYNTAQAPKKNNLFAQNFNTYSTKNSRGSEENNLKEVYNAGNHEQFVLLAGEVQRTPEINLMLANSYLITGKIESAISSLENMSDESAFRDQKYWYLGLANLKLNDIDKAKEHLVYLQTLSNYKKQEIKEILKALNK